MRLIRPIALGLVAAGWVCAQVHAADQAVPVPYLALAPTVTGAPGLSVAQAQASGTATVQHRADFQQANASREARHVANWVVDSGDNQRKPFVIVDKVDARVFVFDADGRLRGASSALLGLAIGDGSVPGIGTRALSTIRPEERTTPAGRFVANLDKNTKGVDMLWVDYDTAISMHRVVAGTARERRAERLAGTSPSERRISYGCINLPVPFYDTVLRPAFTGTDGIVYVLPETRPAREVFHSYDVDDQTRLPSGS